MSVQIQINAEPRQDVGKGASRRLRRAGVSVPGILYGGGKEPRPITLNANQLGKAMQNEAFFSQIVNVVLDGATEPAVVRDLHRHPASEKVMHIDLMRVRADQVIEVHVPLHFVNEDKCVGVRVGGGSIVHSLTEVELACLPQDLPEYIEVDLAELNVGESVHLSDLRLPAGVTVVALVQGADHDLNVVSVRAARGAGSEGDSA